MRCDIRVITLPLTMLIVGCDNESGSSQTSETPPTPTAPAWFAEEAAERGIDFVWMSGASGKFYQPEITAGGVALLDIDNDGDLDAYFIQAGSLDDPSINPPNQLYENDGTGRFTDITESSGAGDRHYGMGAACGDYDNDGDMDILITNVGPNVLLRNNGDRTFTDVTTEAGVGDDGWGSSTAFVDFDRDGDLDLYVCNYMNWTPESELKRCYNAMGGADYCAPSAYRAPARDVLYRNEGNGTFTNITIEAGIDVRFGNGLGVVWGDFTGDGWPDAFIANDGMPDQLWANQQDGTFKDIARLAGCALDQEGIAKAGMGVTAADIDDDGDLDVLVCNLTNESDSLFINEGSYFVDRTAQMGLRVPTRPYTRFGMAWLDFDNDGYLDLYQANGRVVTQDASWVEEDPYAEPNMLLRGVSEGRGLKFEEVEPRGGTTPLLIHTSRGAAFGDIDNDGGIDIIVTNRDAPAYVLRNIAPDRGHWISFRLLDEHGKDAFNATVIGEVGERTLQRDAITGYSFMASNDPRVHFGLGSAEQMSNVRVRWLDGTEQSFGDRAADQIHVLHKGD